MATQTKEAPHVLIVGAGIVGLLVAQGLRKEGVSFEIFDAEESANTYRPREWGMSIQWGLPMLKDILPAEMYDRIHTAAVDPYYEPQDPGILPTFNGGTGEFIKNIPLLRMYRVSRRRFRKFCSEGINTQYNKRLKDVTYSEDGSKVTTIFEDGSTATGTMLIGADGANSQTRITVFGKENGQASRVPYRAINLHVCYNDAEKARFMRKAHPIMYHAIHPDGYWLFVAVQDIPDPNDPTTWVFQLQTTWKRGENEPEVVTLEHHKARAATFGEPFRSANLWIPEGTKLYENNISYWIPQPWDTKNGRVLFVGDACHPMTFQRGQGLNHGIADARSLVLKFQEILAGKLKVEDAVDAYQKEVIERAGDEVKLSLENTEMLHDWSRMANSAIMQRGGYQKGQEPTPAAK